MHEVFPSFTFDSTASTSGSRDTPSVFIRGAEQTDFFFTSDPGVETYLDRVYIARAKCRVLDSINIQWGASPPDHKELYLIKYNRRGNKCDNGKPDEKFRGFAELTLGEWNYRRLRS